MAPWGDQAIGGLSSHLASLEKVIAIIGQESIVSSHEAVPKRVQELCWFVSRIWPGSRLMASTTLIETLHGLLGLREALRGETELVHAHEVMCLPAARWIARFVGAPVVLTVHSQHTLEAIAAGSLRRGTRDARSAWRREKSAYRNADFVFTVTTPLRAFVLAEAGVDPAKVLVQLNFVDVEGFQPRDASEAREILNREGVPIDSSPGDGRRLVLYPGRLSPRKGVDYLIRAAQDVVGRDRRVHFLITGEGPQLAELMRLRSSLGLDESVTFLGNLPSGLVKYLYNVVDVVVLPSVTIEGVQEGTPMSALEAMASGVPLVCSAIGGLREIVADGETGHLVPEKSPERLAEAILRTLDEDQAAITSRARQYVREHRSLESYAKDLTTFLEGLGARPNSGHDRGEAARLKLRKQVGPSERSIMPGELGGRERR